jgi:hypothetical protein
LHSFIYTSFPAGYPEYPALLILSFSRRAQLDSASLHLAHGLSPYDKIKEDPWENASTLE